MVSSATERTVHSPCKSYSSVYCLKDHGEASWTRGRYENPNADKCALQFIKSLPSVTVTMKTATLFSITATIFGERNQSCARASKTDSF
jgi:hypothetical protein